MKRKLKKLGKAVLGLVIAASVGLVIAGIVFTRQLNAEIAAIRAKGQPVTPEELIEKPLPASENAALVYEQAFNALDDPAVEPQKGLIADFDPKTAGAAKWREVEQALPRLQKVLGLTRQAASIPQCRFEIDWANDQTVLFPKYLAKMRELARLTSIHSRISAKSGDTAAAVDDLDTLFRMAKSMEDAPLFIHQLVRVALCSFATNGVERALEQGDITEAQALRLFTAAGKIDTAQGFRRAWQGERVYLIHFFGPNGFAEMATSGGTGRVPKLIAGGLASAYSHTLLAGDLAIYLGILGWQADSLNLSFPDARSQGLFKEPRTPSYAHMSRSGTSTLELTTRYSAEEQVARTQVLLALQAYKSRFGGYPASIGELKSKLGWKLPKDPFSGKDFIYKQKAKGFLLYSVGPDMKDDGGRPVPENTVWTIDDKGDVVLKWNR